MKETVNVNIGSQAFTLDEDAYRVLRNYLEDIRSRLPEYDTETIGDETISRKISAMRDSMSPMVSVSYSGRRLRISSR